MKKKNLLSLIVVLCIVAAFVLCTGTALAAYAPSVNEGFEAYSSSADFKAAGYDLSESGNMSFPEITPGDKALFLNKTASSSSNTVVNLKWDGLTDGYVVVSSSFCQPSSSSVRVQQIWNGEKKLRPALLSITSGGALFLKCGAGDIQLTKIVYGKWYQLSTVLDMSNSKVYVYLDGQLLNSDGYAFYQAATDVGRLEMQTNDSQAGSLYIDNIYVDNFSSMDDAYLAIKAKNIAEDSLPDQYSKSFINNFKTEADSYLERISAGTDNEASDSLRALVDSAIAQINDVLFKEDFESYTAGSSPSSGYVASANNKIVNESDTNIIELTNAGSRTRLLKGGININSYADISFRFMQKTKSQISRLAGAYNGDGKLSAFEIYSNGANVAIKTTIDNSTSPITIIPDYEAEKWYDISVKINYGKQEVTAYVDGEKKATLPFINNFIQNTVVEGNNTYTYDNAPVARVFDTLNDNKGTYYLDDIVVKTYLPTPDYSVAKTVFSDSEGAECKRLVPGGSVDSVYITKNASGNATLYTAVYENDELASISFSDISSYSAGTTFEVPVELEIGTVSNTVVKQFVWDELKPVTVNTLRTGNAKGSKVILLGDSTVASYDKAKYYPQAGWGEMLSNYMDTEVEIINFAVPGNTLKATVTNGILDNALSQTEPGDFVLIQYAHNDSKTELDVYADAVREYRAYLNYFAQSVRAKGAIPVFVTSPVRRVNATFGRNSVLCSYADAMKSVARQIGADVIDLNTASNELIECLETEEANSSKNIYLFLEANDSRYFGEGSEYTGSDYNKSSTTQDNTHFCEYGADVIAGIVADGLKAIGFELSERIDAVTHIPVMP